jgi:hypothetical protein
MLPGPSGRVNAILAGADRAWPAREDVAAPDAPGRRRWVARALPGLGREPPEGYDGGPFGFGPSVATATGPEARAGPDGQPLSDMSIKISQKKQREKQPLEARHSLSRTTLLQLLTVVAAGALTYAAMLDNEFFYDDYRWVWSAHTLFNPKTVFTTSLYGFYRPVVCIAFWINERLFGLDPFSYNLVNLLLHLANCVLVYVLVRRVTRERALAWLTALLFAGGFENYGAILWISGRTTLIAFFFFALGLLAGLEFFRRGGFRYYLALLACFILSIFAKETAFSFLLFLPVFYILLPKRRPLPGKRWILLLLPLVLAVAFNFYSRVPFAGQTKLLDIKPEYVFPNFVASILKPAVHPYLQRGAAWPRMLAFVVFAVLLYRGRRFLSARDSHLGETRLMLLALAIGVVSALPTVLLQYDFFGFVSIQQTRYQYFPSLGGALGYAFLFLRWIRTGFVPPGGSPPRGERVAFFLALALFFVTLSWELAHFAIRIVRYAGGPVLFAHPVRFVLRGLFWSALSGTLAWALFGGGAGTKAFRRAGTGLFVLLVAARMLQGIYVESRHDRNARIHKFVVSALWNYEQLDADSVVYVQQEFMGEAEYAAGAAMEGYPWEVHPVKTLPEGIRAREPGRRYFRCVIDNRGARMSEYLPPERGRGTRPGQRPPNGGAP